MKIKVYTIDFQLPRWLKRGLIYVGIPVMVLSAAAAVWADWSASTSSMAAGQKISAAVIRDDLLYLKAQVDSATARLGKTAVIQTQIVSNSGTAQPSSGSNGGRSGWLSTPACGTDYVLLSGGCYHAEAGGAWAGHPGGNLIMTASQTDGVHWNCYFKNLDTASYTIYAVGVCGKAVPAAN